jgi:hypothetical protein
MLGTADDIAPAYAARLPQRLCHLKHNNALSLSGARVCWTVSRVLRLSRATLCLQANID